MNIELTMPMGRITSSVYPTDYRETFRALSCLFHYRMAFVFEGSEVAATLEDLWWFEPNVSISFTGTRRN